MADTPERTSVSHRMSLHPLAMFVDERYARPVEVVAAILWLLLDGVPRLLPVDVALTILHKLIGG